MKPGGDFAAGFLLSETSARRTRTMETNMRTCKRHRVDILARLHQQPPTNCARYPSSDNDLDKTKSQSAGDAACTSKSIPIRDALAIEIARQPTTITRPLLKDFASPLYQRRAQIL